jgi:RecB family exonuclease
MTDADSSRFPGPSSDQALLDDKTRRAVNDSGESAHLPTLHEKRRQKEALFRRLLALGETRTMIIRPKADHSGRPLSDSPFISAGSFGEGSGWVLSEGTPPRVPSGEGEKRRGIFPRTARAARSGKTSKTRVPLSGIDEFAGCPFSYWCRKIARLEAPPRPDLVPDRRTLGIVMHEVWRVVWNGHGDGGSRSLRAILESEWDRAISSLAPRYPAISDERSLPGMDELKTSMISLAELQDDTMTRARDAGFSLSRAAAEYKLGELETENAVFAGRADRVDFWVKDAEEIAVITDYKLGRSDRYAKSLQLPSYAVLISAGGTRAGGFAYMCHGDARIRGAWSDDLKDAFGRPRDPSCAEKMEAARDAMSMMDDAAGLGEYTANYDSPLCRACDYTTICRRAERRGETEPAAEDSRDDGE